MRPLLLLALHLAFSRRKENRWRLTALVIAAAISTFSALSLIAGTQVMTAQDSRNANRAPVPVADRATAVGTWWLDTADTIDGQQYSVITIQPLRRESRSPLPPGLTGFPDPGQAVLSPRLAAIAAARPEVAARYPDAADTVIGPEGLRDPGELFAYVRPDETRSLELSPQALLATGFGGPGAINPGVFLAPTVDAAPLRLAMLGFVVVPALVLLTVAVRSEAPVRDRRVLVLQSLGCGRASTALLVAGETVLITAVGALIAWGAFWLFQPHVREIPGIAYEVLPADTRANIPAAIGATVLVLAAAVLLAVVSSPRLGALGSPARPVLANYPLSRWRLIPLAVGITLCLGAAVLGGVNGANIFMIGVAVALVGVPLFIGPVIKRTGDLLRFVPSLPSMLAGRRLTADPSHASRYLAGAMVLLFVVVNGQAWLSRLDSSIEQPNVNLSGTAVSRVTGTDLRWNDGKLLERAGASVAIPFLVTAQGEEVLTARCEDIAALLATSNVRCEAATPRTAQQAARLMSTPSATLRPLGLDPARDRPAVFGAGYVVDLRNVPEDERQELRIGGFYAASAPWKVATVRAVAYANFPGPFVFTPEDLKPVPSPLGKYIVAGMRLAGIYALLAVVIAFIDATFRRRRDYGLLTALGASRGAMGRIILWEAASPVVTAMVPTLIAATVSAWTLVTVANQGLVSLTFVWQLFLLGVALGMIAAAVAGALVLPTVDPAVRND